jgi:ABC-type nitrate/sulfonate/bicarbonate transport system substrate-binding protein
LLQSPRSHLTPGVSSLSTTTVIGKVPRKPVASSFVGGQADAGILSTSVASPLIGAGKVQLLAWTDEEASFQVSAIWTSTKTANERPETVKRFLTASRRAGEDYAAAFIGKDGKQHEGPGAARERSAA